MTRWRGGREIIVIVKLISLYFMFDFVYITYYAAGHLFHYRF